MKITSAKFIKGIVGTDKLLDDGVPQIAFIGRSNVGKSSTINSLAKDSSLAKTSSVPGSTRQINIFLINRSFYLIDLPGYGFARSAGEGRENIRKLINWYLFDSHYDQKKIVMIIDAYIGPTDDDLGMLSELEKRGKDIVILANKVDKIKKSEYKKQIKKLEEIFNGHKVIQYSAKEKIGIGELVIQILE